MRGIFPRWLWPRLLEVPKLPAVEPGPLLAESVVHEFSKTLIARQSADYDALDTKAATVIGAVLVFVGLTLPNLSPHYVGQWLLAGCLFVVLGYTLVTSLAGYHVTVLRGPWTPEVALGVLHYKEEAARLALTFDTLRAYVGNYPTLQRKAQFVRLSLYSLTPAAILSAAMFVFGAFR